MGDRSISVLERSEKLREWAVDLLDMEATDRLERYVLFLERRGDKFREKVGRGGQGAAGPAGVKHAELSEHSAIFDLFLEKRVWFQLRSLSPSAVSVYNRLEVLKLERKSVFHGMSETVKKELADLWRWGRPL